MPPSPIIIHVLPYQAVGGAEVAARSVPAGDYPDFRLGKLFAARKPGVVLQDGEIASRYASENDPRAYLESIVQLLRIRPDFLVLSLWRAGILGLIYKLLRPRARLVLFLHNTKDAHWVDRLVTRLTARCATEIWADSRATAVQRLGRAYAQVRAISFLVERRTPVAASVPAPNFIFWGRLHSRKRINIALEFFVRLLRRFPEATFLIIGPDGGAEASLRQQVSDTGLGASVKFHPAMAQDQLAEAARGCSFFLQTSAFEGMAMSVAEAMQLGLVPVVTPVGEIATYVEDRRNGVWFQDADSAVADVAALLGNPPAYAAMREAAIQSWNEKVPLYRDSFLASCGALVASEAVNG